MAQQLLRHAQDDDNEDDVILTPSKPLDVDFNTNTHNNNGEEGSGGGGASGGGKAARLPRWTRQEILVLIQGKRVAENRVRRGSRTITICEQPIGEQQQKQVQVEPKWATVSSYCKRHGVNRGPVQCRKRWSNLAGDFKKIKEWDSRINDESESFWLMRNDVRRERKLPGFFDREVFDILNSNSNSSSNMQVDHLSHLPVDDITTTQDDALVFDSGRSAAADDGLFSDFEQQSSAQQQTEQEQEREQEREREREHEQEQAEEIDRRSSPGNEADVEVHVMGPSPLMAPIPAPTPISEKQYQPMSAEATGPETNQGKQQAGFQPEIGSTSGEGRKRRRVLAEEEGEGQDELVQVLEKNGRVLSAQLDAYNINLKLDREERKDHATSLVAVLNKLADALERIADKL